MRTFKHLTFTDRLKIEVYLQEGKKAREIATLLGVHYSTIYREIKRGQYKRLLSDYREEIRYSPEIADERYQSNLSVKGVPLKIGNDHSLATFIEDKIVNEGYSPAAVLGEIQAEKLEFSTNISISTLYSYIEKGVFFGITSSDLPVKHRCKRKYCKVRPARAPKGKSIEKRPDEINKRQTFGHWEMDCVEGKKGTKKTLLVLTERLTRKEIIRLMPDQTARSVVRTLNSIERENRNTFKDLFKSITVDNGSEFANCEGMERSITGGKRTTIYYCHPYSSWERGSNENQNKLIRRHFPKGSSFQLVTKKHVQKAEDWINHYPREIFNWHCSNDLYEAHLNSI